MTSKKCLFVILWVFVFTNQNILIGLVLAGYCFKYCKFCVYNQIRIFLTLTSWNSQSQAKCVHINVFITFSASEAEFRFTLKPNFIDGLSTSLIRFRKYILQAVKTGMKKFQKWSRARKVSPLAGLAFDLTKTEKLSPKHVTISFYKYNWLTSLRRNEISFLRCLFFYSPARSSIIFVRIDTLFKQPKRKNQILLLKFKYLIVINCGFETNKPTLHENGLRFSVSRFTASGL